jgi:hypothetical protein
MNRNRFRKPDRTGTCWWYPAARSFWPTSRASRDVGEDSDTSRDMTGTIRRLRAGSEASRTTRSGKSAERRRANASDSAVPGR